MIQEWFEDQFVWKVLDLAAVFPPLTHAAQRIRSILFVWGRGRCREVRTGFSKKKKKKKNVFILPRSVVWFTFEADVFDFFGVGGVDGERGESGWDVSLTFSTFKS